MRLEELELDVVEIEMLKLIWRNMATVQKLIIGSVRDNSLKTVQFSLKPTRNIKELILRKDVPVNIFRQLLDGTPDLKVLRVPTMTARMLNSISHQLVNLDVLEIHQFIGSLPDLTNICTNIKNIEIQQIISMREYNKEVRKNLKKESKWKMIWRQVTEFLKTLNCFYVVVVDD